MIAPEIIEDREFYVHGMDLDVDAITEVIASVLKVEKVDNEVRRYYGESVEIPPIKVYVNTYGGDARAALGLYDTIRSCQTPVYTIGLGVASSAGFIIYLAGHTRYAYEHSSFMWHNVQSEFSGSTQEMGEDYIRTKTLNEVLDGIVLKRTKIRKPILKNMSSKKQEWWFFSDEALSLGVVDEIL